MTKAFMTHEFAREIMAKIALGETVTKACQDAGIWHSTFTDYCRRHPEMTVEYARSRQLQIQTVGETFLDLSNAEPERTQEGRICKAWVQLNKQKADDRKWLLSKLIPKTYGDRGTFEKDTTSNVEVEI